MGKANKLEGVQVKSGGWCMWHLRTGWGNWACLGCTRDLIALFHLGGYRWDRARLSLKMPGERTGANSYNLLQGKLWPHRRKKKFSQWGESGSGRGQRGDGTFVLRDTWNKALRELIWLWSKLCSKQIRRTSGSYPLSWTPQVFCVINNCSTSLLFLIIFLLKFQACIK